MASAATAHVASTPQEQSGAACAPDARGPARVRPEITASALRSLPVSNEHLKHALGWRPRFPAYREALAARCERTPGKSTVSECCRFRTDASALADATRAPALDDLRQPVSSALGLLLSRGKGDVSGEPPQTAPPPPIQVSLATRAAPAFRAKGASAGGGQDARGTGKRGRSGWPFFARSRKLLCRAAEPIDPERDRDPGAHLSRCARCGQLAD